jgi:L,D-transpeptidase catalytic domain/Putative peptidoglycan binding domain
VKRVAVSFVRMALWKRAVLSLVLFLSAAIALAPSAGPSKRIPNGVRIAGVNVSGLDAGQARQQIGARFGAPLRFKFARQHWTAATTRLGATMGVEDAVSSALRADNGDDIGVRVDVDREAVRSYVASLDQKFGIPAANAVVVGLVDGHPEIADSRWGRTVRRQTMVRAIVRTLRTRIRPPLPVVMKTLKPSVSKSGFGPVIVIHRGSNSLQLFKGETPWRSFRVATGQARYPTPTGSFRIVDMQMNPWWRPPDSDWAKGLKPIPPGPGNPLGTRWMGLTAPGVGIHGTPDAASIGYSASHGCIRMFIPDATWLFDHVRLGTPVLIVDT